MKTLTDPNLVLVPSTPFWTSLSEQEQEKMDQHTVETPYEKDQYIFEEGSNPPVAFFVQSGVVKCTKSSRQGRTVTIQLIMPGDPFCCKTFPGSLIAMTNTVIREMSRETLENIMSANPKMAMQLIISLANRLREAQEITAAYALYPAEYRLAILLQNVAHRAIQANLATPLLHNEHTSLRLDFPLKRQDLADLAGLTLPTTSKLMTQFKRDGLITGTANNLVIPDLQRLQTFTKQI